MLTFSCIVCQQRYVLPEQAAGRPCVCEACGMQMTVPTPDEPIRLTAADCWQPQPQLTSPPTRLLPPPATEPAHVPWSSQSAASLELSPVEVDASEPRELSFVSMDAETLSLLDGLADEAPPEEEPFEVASVVAHRVVPRVNSEVGTFALDDTRQLELSRSLKEQGYLINSSLFGPLQDAVPPAVSQQRPMVLRGAVQNRPRRHFSWKAPHYSLLVLLGVLSLGTTMVVALASQKLPNLHPPLPSVIAPATAIYCGLVGLAFIFMLAPALLMPGVFTVSRLFGFKLPDDWYVKAIGIGGVVLSAWMLTLLVPSPSWVTVGSVSLSLVIAHVLLTWFYSMRADEGVAVMTINLVAWIAPTVLALMAYTAVLEKESLNVAADTAISPPSTIIIDTRQASKSTPGL